MPDGPSYDDDFYAWTKYQAKVLRDMRVGDNRFDRDNVVEEIESLGKEQRDAVRSQVRRILEHFLKLEYSLAEPPRHGWRRSIIEARAQLGDKLSPSLRRGLRGHLPTLYETAREAAEEALREFGEDAAANRLPPVCPYTLAEIIERSWYPEPQK
jgi:HEAT repeat protein